MSGPDTNIQWFIARDGKQHGPISDIEIRKLVELSHLKPTDLVWCQGFSDWRSAGSVFPIVEASPAPQPAPQAGAPSSAPHATSPAPGQGQGPGQGPGPTAGPSPGPGPSPAGPSAMGAPSPGGPTPGHPGPQPGGHPNPAAAPMRGAGPAGANPQQPYSPFGGTQPGPRPTAPIDTRAAPTRPLGSPIAPGPFTAPSPGSGPAPGPAGPGPGPSPGPGPGLTPGLGAMPGQGQRPTTDMRRPSEISVPARASAQDAGGKRRGLFIAAGLITMTAAGAWLASQHKEAIFAFVQSAEDADKPADEPQQAAAASLPAAKPPAETATATPVAAVAPAPDEMDRKLQARTMWVTVKQQLPEIYQGIVAQAARMTAEGKPQSDVTAFLVTELVKMRRENAQHALAASTARHKELAAAFLANLNELSRESGDGCYEFISRGENSQAILSRIDDPARSTQIEAQVVAIVQAIVEGKAQPASHPAPVKQDYDVLAGELGRLGWTQADMQLFANPKELAKAPRARVCSMLKDWFTAHLAIQDPSTQERLLFETLKPVVAG